MDRDSSSTSPWEYMDFELQTRKGDSREYSVAIRLRTGEAQVLLREFLYDSDRDEYLCLSFNTPLVRYLELPQPVERLPMMSAPGTLGMLVSPLGLGQPNVKREKWCVEEAIKALQVQQ